MPSEASTCPRIAGMIWAASRLSWASWATAVASKPWMRTSWAPKTLSTNRQATVRKRIRRRGLPAGVPPRTAVLRRPEPPPLPPVRARVVVVARRAGAERALVGPEPPGGRPAEGRAPFGRAPGGATGGARGRGRLPDAVLPVAALPPVCFGVDRCAGRGAALLRVVADPGRARPEGGGVLRWVTALSVGVVSVVRGVRSVSGRGPGRRPGAWWCGRASSSCSWSSSGRGLASWSRGCWEWRRSGRASSPRGCSWSGPWPR